MKGVSEESYDQFPVKEVSVKPNDVRILNVRAKEPIDLISRHFGIPGVTDPHAEV